MSEVEEVEVRISVTTDNDGAMVMYVSAHPDGTEPSAFLKLWVDPERPNSFEEFEKVSSVLTDEFLAESGRAMKAWVEQMAAKASAQEIVDVRDRVSQGLLLQGFTPEQVDELNREADGL